MRAGLFRATARVRALVHRRTRKLRLPHEMDLCAASKLVGRLSQTVWVGPLAAGLALGFTAGIVPAWAGQVLPVPTVVIYPGDVIRDTMVTEREMPADFTGVNSAVLDRTALVGKSARRTLLPGIPVPNNAVGEPKLVSVGAMVRVVFAEGGLTISTYASALQGGSVGDVIPLRNKESGLTVSGTIQSDGSVRVGNG